MRPGRRRVADIGHERRASVAEAVGSQRPMAYEVELYPMPRTKASPTMTAQFDHGAIDIPAGALDPLINHVTAMIATSALDFTRRDGQMSRPGS